MLHTLHRSGVEGDVKFIEANIVDHLEPNRSQEYQATTCNAPSSAFEGADLVIMLAGAREHLALRAVAALSMEARREGVLVMAMIAPTSAGGKETSDIMPGVADHIDVLIVLSPTLRTATPSRMPDAFVCATVDGLSEGFQATASVSGDFSAVRSVLANAGNAYIGIGIAKGEGRAARAVLVAVADIGADALRQADGILVLIAGSRSLCPNEIDEVRHAIQPLSAASAVAAFGAHWDERIGDMVRVTVIATRHLPPR
jgi:cell division protein FtsZ